MKVTLDYSLKKDSPYCINCKYFEVDESGDGWNEPYMSMPYCSKESNEDIDTPRVVECSEKIESTL